MAQEQISLNDILSDEPKKPEAPAPEPAEPAAAAPEANDEAKAADEQRREDYKSRRTKARDKEAIAQGKVRDPDTGQFVSPKETPAAAAPEPKVEPAAAPAAAEPAKPAAPAQEFTEKERAFMRAAQEERRKRQELESRLAALESGKPAEPAKTFWDDPEGALARQKQELAQAVTGMRLQTSEGIARTRYTDFDAKAAVFAELAQTTPGLVQQMVASMDPAEFAYKTAANHIAIKEAGGIEELKKKIEADTEARVRAKIEAELKAKAEELAAQRAALPPTLSDARATGGATKPVWNGPPSMSSILND